MWFDVGFKRYTTSAAPAPAAPSLWFDVGFKRYTTFIFDYDKETGCGLM